MDIEIIGLLLIVFGWLIQMARANKGKKEIDPWFVRLYATGLLLVVLVQVYSGWNVQAILNLVAMLLAVYVAMRTMMKPRRKR